MLLGFVLVIGSVVLAVQLAMAGGVGGIASLGARRVKLRLLAS